MFSYNGFFDNKVKERISNRVLQENKTCHILRKGAIFVTHEHQTHEHVIRQHMSTKKIFWIFVVFPYFPLV